MESHTIQVMLDQAEVELEAAERREREHEVQGRILHSITKGKRDAARVLDRMLRLAQQVRNILNRIVNPASTEKFFSNFGLIFQYVSPLDPWI
jgi:hypothetical protein